MRNTLIFAGSSCPVLASKICENLGMDAGKAELTQFSNGETSVRILTSVREKDVFVVQSGSPRINDTIMELLIMISACNGGSANKITAVLPYFPYSRQSKKKWHRGAITARMLANLLGVAGVKHVITVDLHASQMQGFFRCPVDNLHAEPLIARWIRHNVPNWREAVVVSKNAGGTKRVTSLADALKLNFGMVTTDRKRGGGNMSASMIMNHLDGIEHQPGLFNRIRTNGRAIETPIENHVSGDMAGYRSTQTEARDFRNGSDGPSVPTSTADRSPYAQPQDVDGADESNDEGGYNDQRAEEVTQGRLVQGHIVPDDFPSPATSAADASVHEDDPMTLSRASSSFAPEPLAGGSGEGGGNSDEEEDGLHDPKLEHMITLVGDVKGRTVLIVDDMIDKPGSWIAAAETVIKRGRAKKVYCVATHGLFGGDCLEQMEACECIDSIVVTNSYPLRDDRVVRSSKLAVIDLSFLLAEAIRRNHYGESISPLFQHIPD